MSGHLAVVGTDTGIGKTVVTAALVARVRERGVGARAIKPAQTGYPEDDDAGFVSQACGESTAAKRLRTFGEPLAPAVAARRVDDPISYDSLLADTDAALEESEMGIVEGAGGLRVPLSNDPRKDIVDLVADLDVPALVVARSGLGTLNHSALTAEALRRRGVPVLGVVLNRYTAASVAERSNPDELERMTDRPVWTLPEVELETPADVEKLTDELPPLHRQMGEEPPV
jgi:dethiobiotin synthetase